MKADFIQEFRCQRTQLPVPLNWFCAEMEGSVGQTPAERFEVCDHLIEAGDEPGANA
jgi:hypothetical protein